MEAILEPALKFANGPLQVAGSDAPVQQVKFCSVGARHVYHVPYEWLAARSQYYRAALTNGFLEGQTATLSLPECEEEVFQFFLAFLLIHNEVGWTLNDIQKDRSTHPWIQMLISIQSRADLDWEQLMELCFRAWIFSDQYLVAGFRQHILAVISWLEEQSYPGPDDIVRMPFELTGSDSIPSRYLTRCLLEDSIRLFQGTAEYVLDCCKNVPGFASTYTQEFALVVAAAENAEDLDEDKLNDEDREQLNCLRSHWNGLPYCVDHGDLVAEMSEWDRHVMSSLTRSAH